MKTDAERSARYDAKTNAATVALIVAAVLPDARTNFADPMGMSDMLEHEARSRAVLLNDETIPVPNIYIPAYLAYSRELWSLIRRGIAGAGLTNAAQGVYDKWNAKGFLDGELLSSIAYNVYNLSLGPPPP